MFETTQANKVRQRRPGKILAVGQSHAIVQVVEGLKQPRKHRTRLDTFEAAWAEVEKKLEEAPELEEKTLFDWLCEREGAKYQEG